MFRLPWLALVEGAGAIKVAKEYRPIVDNVEALVGLDDADRLADESFAEEDATAQPLDVAVIVNPAHLMVSRVFGLSQATAIGSRRRLIVR